MQNSEHWIFKINFVSLDGTVSQCYHSVWGQLSGSPQMGGAGLLSLAAFGAALPSEVRQGAWANSLLWDAGRVAMISCCGVELKGSQGSRVFWESHPCGAESGSWEALFSRSASVPATSQQLLPTETQGPPGWAPMSSPLVCLTPMPWDVLKKKKAKTLLGSRVELRKEIYNGNWTNYISSLPFFMAQ